MVDGIKLQLHVAEFRHPDCSVIFVRWLILIQNQNLFQIRKQLLTLYFSAFQGKIVQNPTCLGPNII